MCDKCRKNKVCKYVTAYYDLKKKVDDLIPYPNPYAHIAVSCREFETTDPVFKGGLWTNETTG